MQWRSHWGGKGAECHPWQRKNAKKQEKSGKYQEIGKKSGKIEKKEEKSGRKGKNREVSFTLPLLTDRAGYATGYMLYFVFRYCVSCNISASNTSIPCEVQWCSFMHWCSSAFDSPSSAPFHQWFITPPPPISMLVKAWIHRPTLRYNDAHSCIGAVSAFVSPFPAHSINGLVYHPSPSPYQCK